MPSLSILHHFSFKDIRSGDKKSKTICQTNCYNSVSPVEKKKKKATCMACVPPDYFRDVNLDHFVEDLVTSQLSVPLAVT